VHFLTDIDYGRHVALVCAAGSGADEKIVGEARFTANPMDELRVRHPDPRRLAPDGHRGILMDGLIRAARERGFATMESTVLANNAPMLRFAHALGFEVEPIEGDLTTVRIERRLQRTAAPAGARELRLSRFHESQRELVGRHLRLVRRLSRGSRVAQEGALASSANPA